MKHFARLIFLWIALAGSCWAEALRLPITFVQGIPIVSLNLNGRDYPFMLDTGSYATLQLSQTVADEIAGLTYTGKKSRNLTLNGAVHENREFKVSNLRVNGLPPIEITDMVYSPGGLSVGPGFAGPANMSLMGLGFFAGRRAVIDYASKSMTLLSDEGSDNESIEGGWQPIAAEWTNEGVVLRLSNARTTYRMILDTGANISFVKDVVAQKRDETEKCDFNLGPNQPCRMITVSIQSVEVARPILMSLPNELTADGLIGKDFLERFAVYLDGRRKSVQIKPTPR